MTTTEIIQIVELATKIGVSVLPLFVNTKPDGSLQITIGLILDANTQLNAETLTLIAQAEKKKGEST